MVQWESFVMKIVLQVCKCSGGAKDSVTTGAMRGRMYYYGMGGRGWPYSVFLMLSLNPYGPPMCANSGRQKFILKDTKQFNVQPLHKNPHAGSLKDTWSILAMSAKSTPLGHNPSSQQAVLGGPLQIVWGARIYFLSTSWSVFRYALWAFATTNLVPLSWHCIALGKDMSQTI